MAAIAVGVAAAATAAAAAASAAQKAKAAGSAPGAPGMAKWESVYNKGTKDILDEERSVIENAVNEGNLMQPEIYRLLGYEPVYEGEDVDTKGIADKLARAESRVNDAQTKLIAARSAKPGTVGGKAGKERQIKKFARERRIANNEAAELRQQLGEAQTTGRRIVGLKPLESGIGDPTGSKDGLFKVAFDLENEALARALKGEEPVDATLKTAYDEKERMLRERLRRQLGQDYETSTAGAEALANFDRERAEAFKQYNMEATQLYGKLTSERAADLSNLTGQRIAQLLAPSKAGAERGSWLGGMAKDRLAFSESQRKERELQFAGDVNKWKGRMAKAEAQGELYGAAASGVGSIAGGVSSAAGGMNFGSSGGSSVSSILNSPATRAGGDLDLTR